MMTEVECRFSCYQSLKNLVENSWSKVTSSVRK